MNKLDIFFPCIEKNNILLIYKLLQCYIKAKNMTVSGSQLFKLNTFITSVMIFLQKTLTITLIRSHIYTCNQWLTTINAFIKFWIYIFKTPNFSLKYWTVLCVYSGNQSVWWANLSPWQHHHMIRVYMFIQHRPTCWPCRFKFYKILSL